MWIHGTFRWLVISFIKKFNVLPFDNRLGMMVAGGVVLAIFTDHAAVYLAKLAYIKGKKNRDLVKS